ncbi:unnamed protein product [Sphagnum balticum]
MILSHNLLPIFCIYAAFVIGTNGETYDEDAVTNALFEADSSDSKESQESVEEEQRPPSLDDLVNKSLAQCNQSVLDEFGDDTHCSKYANCTRISGNVEITGLSLADLKHVGGIGGTESDDILNDIFGHIEQIDGYLLVYNVTVALSIELRRLQYIWGNTLHPVQLDTGLIVHANNIGIRNHSNAEFRWTASASANVRHRTRTTVSEWSPIRTACISRRANVCNSVRVRVLSNVWSSRKDTAETMDSYWGKCVSECPEGMYARPVDDNSDRAVSLSNAARECQTCAKGQNCPVGRIDTCGQTRILTNVLVCTLDYRTALTATSLATLPHDCTEVQGSLNIMEYMFTETAKLERLYLANLTTYFSRVERIRGHLSIIGNNNDSTNELYGLHSIDFLPNLKRIDGLGKRLKLVESRTANHVFQRSSTVHIRSGEFA